MTQDQITQGAAIKGQYRQADRDLLVAAISALIGWSTLLAIIIGDAYFLGQQQTMPQAAFVYGGSIFFDFILASALLRLTHGQKRFWSPIFYLENYWRGNPPPTKST